MNVGIEIAGHGKLCCKDATPPGKTEELRCAKGVRPSGAPLYRTVALYYNTHIVTGNQ